MNKPVSALGKRVGPNLYLHISSLSDTSPAIQSLVGQACEWANLKPGKDFNVVKANDNRKDLSLLHYPCFFDDAFPVLNRYWAFDATQETFRHRTYNESFNPPILHRKELLLPLKHPDRPRFSALTKEAEAIGLFDEANRIGFMQEWEDLLKRRGYQVKGHELVPIGNAEIFDSVSDSDQKAIAIQRHLTALSRTNLSAPIQTLARFGFLDGNKTIFDYGCGRGSDVEFLKDNGIQAEGWDPYYADQYTKQSADIVNLGFVINVIEDRSERDEALQGAFDLAKEWLVVSAMLEHSNTGNGRPYADGILTSRNTFQKYYSQADLGQYIEEVLGVTPLPIAPGIFYAFKDRNAEQLFSTQRVARKSGPAVRRRFKPINPLERAARSSLRNQKKYEANIELLEPLWQLWLKLGREPKTSEVDFIEDLRNRVGSYPAALKLILQQKGSEAIQEVNASAQIRTNDLTVYFAQLKFVRKRLPRPLEPSLKADIKHFFGGQDNAMAHGEELLLSILNKEKINSACEIAAEQGLGWLITGHSLQLHTSLVSQLPPILRTYVHCATSLYGDVTSADLVKIHIRSGKLTLMNFDDFDGKPLPKMIERIKINLMSQRLDFFDYGEVYTPPYLYLKSRYMNESCRGFGEQLMFDDCIQSLELIDLEGHGPIPNLFDGALKRSRYEIDGFSLRRSRTIPNIDTPCSNYFTYRDLIQCGETQKNSNVENLPKQPDSYSALLDLSSYLLDPIVDYFGMINITYGFCSAELLKSIKKGVAPKLDQHASFEKNKHGNLICSRKGAAVDFIVEDEDMLEVAQWIAKNLPFDRLYFYGTDRPIHLSYSKRPAKQVFSMEKSGRNLMPRKMQL